MFIGSNGSFFSITSVTRQKWPKQRSRGFFPTWQPSPVSAPLTQNQALNAVLFLYRHVLRRDVGYVNGVVRANRPKRLPTVLTRQEVRSILGNLAGLEWIMTMLLYGAGLRLMECLRLRVKDVDFSSNEIGVRSGKGDKDRVTMLPGAIKEPLLTHLQGSNDNTRKT